MCENKYAQNVLTEHYKEPKFEVGQQVYFRDSIANTPHKALPHINLQRGAIVLRANAAPIDSAAKGAKKYLVLPIGDPHGAIIEERWLKSRRDKKNERRA